MLVVLRLVSGENMKFVMWMTVVRRRLELASSCWFTRHRVFWHCNWNATSAASRLATNSIVISDFRCCWTFVVLRRKWTTRRWHTSCMLCLFTTARRRPAATITALCCRRLDAGTRWMMAWFVFSAVNLLLHGSLISTYSVHCCYLVHLSRHSISDIISV